MLCESESLQGFVVKMSKEVASNGKAADDRSVPEMDAQMTPDVRAHTDMILDVVDGTGTRMRNNSSVRETNGSTTSPEGEKPVVSPNENGLSVKEAAEKDVDESLSLRIQQEQEKLKVGAFVESEKGTIGQGQPTAGTVTPVAPEQPVRRDTTQGQLQASAGGTGNGGVDTNGNNASADPESQTHVPFPENVAMARAISETDLENEMRDRIMGSAVVAEEHKERRGVMTKASIGIVVVIAIIIAVVLATSASSNDGGENVGIEQPTEVPTLAPVTPAPTPLPDLTEQQQDLLDHLTAISFDEGRSFENRTSPQFRAMWWLARSLEEEGIASSLNIEELGERYAMAALFYSTNGDSEWFRTEGWLDPNLHICDWYPASEGPGNPGFCYEHGRDSLVSRIRVRSQRDNVALFKFLTFLLKS